ncbi:MAG: hypothetical protein H6557_05280 [Lewinellaceae bacterium]|nr:hypothetical protein [Lewinellaceae bacterium]
MTNSKLIDALRQLSARERTKFRELVYSPYFNKNRKVRKLAGYLLQYAPDFQDKALEKPAVFPVVFGNQAPYRELQLNNVISDTLQLLYEYLAQQAIEQEAPIKRAYLMKAFLQRRMERHIGQNARRCRQLLDQAEGRSYHYYYHRQQLAGQLDRHALLHEERGYNEHLQEMNDTLDLYYFCNKLRTACDMANRNKAINANYQCHFIDTLLQAFEQAPDWLRQEPALQVYYQALLMLRGEEERHYQEVRRLLYHNPHVFPREELNDLYDYVQNFCVKQINSGQARYYEQILDLYKEMLGRELLLRSGYLTQWTYINIVTAGIRLRDFEWTEQFIHAYREHLAPEVRGNVYTYNLAALEFERKNYHLALQSLQDVEFSDAFYHMAAKIIQLKSYYELEETEAFFSLMEASRKYIRRNRQLSDYQKQSNAGFLRIAGKLNNLRLQRGIADGQLLRQQLQQLEQELQQASAIANKGWLRQKVGELIG